MTTTASATLASLTLMNSAAARDLADAYREAGAELAPGTPADKGCYFPAEWVPHERTLMQFVTAQNWPRAKVEGAREEWALVANAVAEFEPLTMAVTPEDRPVAEKLLGGEIELVEFPMNDCWSRDSGPMIVVNDDGDRAVAGFAFNSWGRKFYPYEDDAMVKARFAAHLDMPFYPAPMVSEGGALHFDGEGTCLTTEECLLNTNRNPDLDRDEIDEILRTWLGVAKIVWVPKGLTPDPITDGHIDGLAAFSGPGRVLLHSIDDSSDPNYEIIASARRILENETDARGRPFEIIDLPLARDVVHMNFYICNGGVVVPVAGDADQDDAPLAILRETFPDHRVVPVSGWFLSQGGGGVHCITQQVPAV